MFLKVILIFILVYLVYFLITVAVLTNFYPNEDKACANFNRDHYYGDGEGVDYITLIDDNTEGLKARINLIENAKETIDVSQFYINTDKTGEIFLGELIMAANRGVKVRIIIDGKYNKVSGLTDDYFDAINKNPNIEIRLYEPFQVMQPWTVNNLLHDKILIIDNRQALISGRNIGDRYFNEQVDNFVYDLDTVITYKNNDDNDFKASGVGQIADYFASLWNHDYTVKKKEVNVNNKIAEELLIKLNGYMKEHPEWFNNKIDWVEKSVPAKRITLLANPFERFNKEPTVWCEIANFINNAEKSVFINSPYIIPTKEITNKLNNNIKNLKINVLTNSAGSTPNIFAFSGYLRYKPHLLKMDNINIYEYHGLGSLHSKSYIIDEQISIVGSYNMDPRSTFLSTETMLVIDSKEYATLLREYYDKKIRYSLLTNDLYDYEDKNDVKALELSKTKKAKLEIMRFVAHIIDHLL